MVTRTVSAELAVQVESPTRLAFEVGIADPQSYSTTEEITFTHNGRPVEWRELAEPHGGRVWLVDAQPGRVELTYQASLTGSAPPAPALVTDELIYLRPSRYCEADRIVGFAGGLFHDITSTEDTLTGVSSWVGTQLDYVSGSSGPTDGAVDTLLAGRGVCRDFAHLAVALLRARGIPARLVAVYAPGLDPMDFHAVTEAFINGAWYVIDATLLAPRESLVRIATGRDAADTAFLSSFGGAITMQNQFVTATIDGDLPVEDVDALVQLQ